MKPLTYILAIALAQSFLSCAQAGCGQFFQGHAYRHVHHVAQAQVFYFAGAATQDEAITRKAIRAELPAIVDAVRQQLQAPQPQRASTALAQNCLRCHSGDSAKAGFRLDGEIDDYTFRRSMEVLAGVDVPQGMKAVVAGLKEGVPASIMQEMLSARPAANKAEPPVVVPPPDESGILR